MRILYGIQGTGNGHISRARHLAAGFAEREDIQVDYFFSGRSPSQYFDMQVFENYNTGRGFTFVTHHGRIHYTKTITQNNVFDFAKEVRSMVLGDYDLVLNDFEPISAWAAKNAGVPSLSVSHQAAFLKQIPTHKQSVLDKCITRYFAPTQYNLGTHWYHFGQPIIPPFVSKDLLECDQVNHDYVLVYLPFENISHVIEQLSILSDLNFVCFHPQITAPRVDRNIRLYPLSKTEFTKKLIASDGVISNCGFELSTECLSLGKPLLVKPLHGQFEQASNAMTLESLGACSVIQDLNAEAVDDWLNNKKSVKIQFPHSCRHFIDWLAAGDWNASKKMRNSLWREVLFPQEIKQKLQVLSQI